MKPEWLTQYFFPSWSTMAIVHWKLTLKYNQCLSHYLRRKIIMLNIDLIANNIFSNMGLSQPLSVYICYFHNFKDKYRTYLTINEKSLGRCWCAWDSFTDSSPPPNGECSLAFVTTRHPINRAKLRFSNVKVHFFILLMVVHKKVLKEVCDLIYVGAAGHLTTNLCRWPHTIMIHWTVDQTTQDEPVECLELIWFFPSLNDAFCLSMENFLAGDD